MIGEFRADGARWRVDFAAGRSIALDLDPHGTNPAFFAAGPVRAEPLRLGAFVGRMAAGGSCNAEVVHFAPHCHGTHTEGLGHVLAEAPPLKDTTETAPGFAWLASVEARAPAACADDAPSRGAAALIPRAALEAATREAPAACRALVLRTLPNDAGKRGRNYDEAPYPVLSRQAAAWLAAGRWRHLLVDTPSLDPADDGGALANHRAWWGLAGDGAPAHAARRSVTEMVFVPDDIPDGLYWLDIGVSPLASDAVPSRPVLYPVKAARP